MNTPETPDFQQPPVPEPSLPTVEPTPVVEPTPIVESPAVVEQTPVVEATPVVEPTPMTAILETVELPAAAGAGGGETGGEWQELLDRLNGWLGDGRVSEIWQQSQRPLKALGAALALLLVLRLLGSVLGALDGVPMLPRLLQLVGLISLLRFCLTRLVRSSERERIVGQWKERWNDFRGRD